MVNRYKLYIFKKNSLFIRETGNGILVIGQEQDSLGGQFSQSETYMGRITNLDVWDKRIDENQVQLMMNTCGDELHGNVYAWPEIKIHLSSDLEVFNINYSFSKKNYEIY